MALRFIQITFCWTADPGYADPLPPACSCRKDRYRTTLGNTRITWAARCRPVVPWSARCWPLRGDGTAPGSAFGAELLRSRIWIQRQAYPLKGPDSARARPQFPPRWGLGGVPPLVTSCAMRRPWSTCYVLAFEDKSASAWARATTTMVWGARRRLLRSCGGGRQRGMWG